MKPNILGNRTVSSAVNLAMSRIATEAAARDADSEKKPVEKTWMTDFCISDCEAANREITKAIATLRKEPGWKSTDPRLVELKSHRAIMTRALSELKQATTTTQEKISEYDRLSSAALRYVGSIV